MSNKNYAQINENKIGDQTSLEFVIKATYKNNLYVFEDKYVNMLIEVIETLKEHSHIPYNIVVEHLNYLEPNIVTNGELIFQDNIINSFIQVYYKQLELQKEYDESYGYCEMDVKIIFLDRYLNELYNKIIEMYKSTIK